MFLKVTRTGGRQNKSYGVPPSRLHFEPYTEVKYGTDKRNKENGESSSS